MYQTSKRSDLKEMLRSSKKGRSTAHIVSIPITARYIRSLNDEISFRVSKQLGDSDNQIISSAKAVTFKGER